MTALVSKDVWFLVAAVALGAYLIHWGDANGFNARKVSQINRELADANARVAAYTQRDEEAAARDEHLREEGYRRALTDLGPTDKCVVTPAMMRAFERIVP